MHLRQKKMSHHVKKPAKAGFFELTPCAFIGKKRKSRLNQIVFLVFPCQPFGRQTPTAPGFATQWVAVFGCHLATGFFSRGLGATATRKDIVGGQLILINDAANLGNRLSDFMLAHF